MQESAFQWHIGGIDPDDPTLHIRLAVMGLRDGSSGSSQTTTEDTDPVLSAEVQFKMPHTTLSRTMVECSIEPKTGDGEVKKLFVNNLCMSGNYCADSQL